MFKRFILIPILLAAILTLTSYSILLLYPASPPVDYKARLFLRDKISLKNGDLIFRRGVSFESQIVLLSDGETEYSHIGIIYNLNGKPFVIHSVPSETNSKNEYIKLESLEDFLSEGKATKFALYRIKDELNNEAQRASSFAYYCYLHKYSFDDDYDLKSDSKLYCTELIWKAYKSAGVDLVNNRFKSIDFIMVNKKMIMPSSIIQSELLKNIYSN